MWCKLLGVCVCAQCLTDCLQEEIRATHGVWEREVSKQRNMDRVRFRDPSNRKRIVSTPTHVHPAVPCHIMFCIIGFFVVWAVVGWVALSFFSFCFLRASVLRTCISIYTLLLNIYKYIFGASYMYCTYTAFACMHTPSLLFIYLFIS